MDGGGARKGGGVSSIMAMPPRQSEGELSNVRNVRPTSNQGSRGGNVEKQLALAT